MSTHGGMGKHQSSAMVSDTWLTPPHIIMALGAFDLDPCAAPEPRPWPTAAEHWTKEHDGLKHDWFGRVWLNPPYGPPPIVGPWLRRMRMHDRGIALIFARTETELFIETVWDCASAVFFLFGRLHFHRANGTRSDLNAGAPSCLVSYGRHDASVLESCKLPGMFIPLRQAFRSK